MNNIIKLTFLAFITFISISCKEKKPEVIISNSGEINRVTPLEFQEKLANYTLIDIRTPGEYAQGRIEGAVNINLYDGAFAEKISAYDKSKPIFIYCRSGSRTSYASKRLLNMGFKKIYDLHGGIISWRRNNLKIVK